MFPHSRQHARYLSDIFTLEFAYTKVSKGGGAKDIRSLIIILHTSFALMEKGLIYPRLRICCKYEIII